MTLPTIALIGRPNVGKSTLFNRLVGRRASLVHDEPGLTRDRIYAQVHIRGFDFKLIDTGGIDALAEAIFQQTEKAIAEADMVFFLVDAKTGILPADWDIADQLRKARKTVYVLANKAESQKALASVGEFYDLGFENVFAVSGEHGQGLEELFEWIPGRAQDDNEKAQDDNKDIGNDLTELALAIVGKPNAGKSSFVNKLLGEERHLVSPEPGTTMDAVDSEIRYAGKLYRLIDTAGIRRKRSIEKDIEKMAVSATLGALDRADVALFLIDAEQGLTEQDLKIASFIDKKSKAVVILVNKWDLLKGKKKAEDLTLHIREKMPFLAHAPIRFISASTGLRIFDALETAAEVSLVYHQRVTTGKVNKMLQDAVSAHQPPMLQGRRLKFFYGTQVSVAPPTFLVTVNDKKGIHFSYERYLTNRIRMCFGFKGAPIRLVFRDRTQV